MIFLININMNKNKKNIPNFIGQYQSEDYQLMKGIINFFEENTDLQKKAIFGNHELDLTKKDALEITISPNQLTEVKFKYLKKYFEVLQEHFQDYLNTWPFLRSLNKFSSGSFHIQKYKKNGHYNSWHTERDSIMNSERVLVFMTYLNDLKKGGETEFLHYGLKINPKVGRTIIWPAEWTHAHKGLPVKEEKYIITGWLHFN